MILDWEGLMRAGIGQLKLHPKDFWALTPLELMLLLGWEPRAAGAGATMRERFEALCAAYPDEERHDGKI